MEKILSPKTPEPTNKSEFGTEDPGSQRLSGSSNVRRNSGTKTRGAPRIYKEINEMTDVDVFSEELLHEFDRAKLTKPAFEEENKTRKFCKHQDIARYLDKQAQLLSEKYGSEYELTPYHIGNRASRLLLLNALLKYALYSLKKKSMSLLSRLQYGMKKN